MVCDGFNYWIPDVADLKPQSNLLRKGRWSERNRSYLITFQTHSRNPYFANFKLARIVIRALMRANGVETLSFVIMPDHVHWLISLTSDLQLSSIIQAVKSVSSRSINRELGRKGRIWQDGFHDHALRKNAEIVASARYIVANPIRAGLAKSIRLYPHWDAAWL